MQVSEQTNDLCKLVIYKDETKAYGPIPARKLINAKVVQSFSKIAKSLVDFIRNKVMTVSTS